MSVPNPATISSKLISIQEQYAPILDDFIKYYVLYKQNPSSNEYTQMFSSIKGNLHKINSQLFTETNTIETSIKYLNDIMSKMNSEIEEEKKVNEILKHKIHDLKNEKNGASEMIDNYQTMYNLQYFTNCTMFLGIILIMTMLYFVYKKRNYM
jgi:hypothetical protein